MSETSVQELRESAYFIAGIPAFHRTPNDPGIEQCVHDAFLFLQSIKGKMEKPSVSGGTRVTSGTVLTAYWLHRTQAGIFNVSVSFMEDFTCALKWGRGDKTSGELVNLTPAELINMDIPKQYDRWKSSINKGGPGFDFG